MPVEAPSQSIITHYRKQLFEIYPYTTPTLEYRCIQDIVEAEKIWKHFNPSPENIYQDLEYIKIFHEAYQYTPHFYTAYKDDVPVACLPLEWIPERNRLEMFGNMSYIHYLFSQTGYEYCIPLLLKQVKLPLESESIFCDKNTYLPSLQEVDTNYILDIRRVEHGMQYLEQEFPGDGRDKFLQQMRKIETLNIKIENGKTEDIEWFFETNKLNF